ncbi:MAG: hypothetical protein ACXABG_13180 [Promethearchaeota archaeon]
MVKCPGCGVEYSLGRKIYHSCADFEIFHGVVGCNDRMSRPWNCNPIEEYNQPKLENVGLLKNLEKLIKVLR